MPNGTKPIIYCVDAIVVRAETDRFVLVERTHGAIQGLALPGGKCDQGEMLDEAVIREVWEETGLTYTPRGVLMTCAEEGRDPRGRYVSTVFYGYGCGSLRDEPGKTCVREYGIESLMYRRDALVLDHARMLETYIRLKMLAAT